MTIEQIRAALPTHIILTPGLHKSQNGDEIGVAQKNGSVVWIAPMFDGRYEWVFERPDGGRDYVVLQTAIDDKIIWRRPIPPHILDNQAFWIWRGDRQEYPTAAELAEVGGIDSWRAQIIAGRLYDKWLLEQMGDV